MTDYQLEIAARQLCALRGINPEERVVGEAPLAPNGARLAVMVYTTAWKKAAQEVLAHYERDAAVQVGRHAPVRPNPGLDGGIPGGPAPVDQQLWSKKP